MAPLGTPEGLNGAIESLRAGALESPGARGPDSAAEEPVPSRDGGAAGAGHVQVGDQGELGDLELFEAEGGVLADAGQEPVAEVRGRLDDAAADKIGAGVGEVGGDGEQAAES